MLQLNVAKLAATFAMWQEEEQQKEDEQEDKEEELKVQDQQSNGGKYRETRNPYLCETSGKFVKEEQQKKEQRRKKEQQKRKKEEEQLNEDDQETKKKKHKEWVTPYLLERSEKGRYVQDFQKMIKNPSMFHDNFHMSYTCFRKLFRILEEHLTPKRKSRPDCIPPQMKLAVVLEYLVTGGEQYSLCSSYRVSRSQMGYLIDAVCDAICEELKKEIAPWNTEAMRRYAEELEEVSNFPNCIGIIDGKHVTIRAPADGAEMFVNHKGFHSIVLLAVCNASYKFTYVDVGAYGSEDYNVFANTKFGQDVLSDRLEFPENRSIGGTTKLPYFLIGDDAFPLCKRIMKPYNGKHVKKDEITFNNRLNKARRCMDNTLGILSWKWACLQRTLWCKPDRAQKIVFACCLLHNFLMRVAKNDYVAIDDLRSNDAVIINHFDGNTLRSHMGRTADYAKFVRNKLKDYVVSEEAGVSHQDFEVE